jgi:hypothetical protein
MKILSGDFQVQRLDPESKIPENIKELKILIREII